MFNLPDLPYGYDGLMPYISPEIMHYHHDGHHVAYTKNLNGALEKYPLWQKKPIEEILRSLNQLPQDIQTVVKNNGGGYYHHSIFWQMMSSKKDQKPNVVLMDKIKHDFGDYAAFQEQFTQGATKIFGSGWEWLVFDNGNLKLVNTQNQDSPISQGLIPLLTLDVWEHAYYLQYYNKRPDYISAWWHVVNWEDVARRLDEAMKK